MEFKKKKIDSTPSLKTVFLQPQDVWIISLGKNIGFEQNGSGDYFSRPVLIIKKFNNQMFWAIPLSSVQKNLDFYFNFVDPQQRHVSAIIAQLRLISIKRCQRFLYRIDKNHFLEIMQKLKGILDV